MFNLQYYIPVNCKDLKALFSGNLNSPVRNIFVSKSKVSSHQKPSWECTYDQGHLQHQGWQGSLPGESLSSWWRSTSQFQLEIMISVWPVKYQWEKKTYRIEEERHYLVKVALESLSHGVPDWQYTLKYDIRRDPMHRMITLVDEVLTLKRSRYILQTIDTISNGNDGGRHMICDGQQLTAPAFFWYGHTVWLISQISHWRQEL